MSTRIVVTGANGQVGRAVLSRLRMSPVETIAVTRNQGVLPACRTLSCGLDSERTFKVLHEADAVIHLAGTLNPRSSNTYYGANVAATAAVIAAARNSKIKRIIYLSFAGANECSSNEHLRTKAWAEQLLWSTGISTVVFRCTYIIGSPEVPGPAARALQSYDGDTVNVLGSGRQMVAPLLVDDVARAVVTALDKGRAGLYELAGPDRMNLDDLVLLLNPERNVRVRHLPQRLARFLSIIHPDLHPALVEVMMNPCLGDSTKATQEFGLTLTPLRSVWKAKSDESGEESAPHRDGERNLVGVPQGTS